MPQPGSVGNVLRCEQKATLVVRAPNGNIPDLSAVLNPLCRRFHISHFETC